MRPLGIVDACASHAMTDEASILDAVHFLANLFRPAMPSGSSSATEAGGTASGGCGAGGGPPPHRHGRHAPARPREIEIGYWFAGAARGRGLAFETVGALVSALEAALPDHRLFAEGRPENEASWCLLERVGFRDDAADGVRPGRRRLVLQL